MSPIGAIILSFFGAVLIALALNEGLLWSGAMLLLPFIGFAVLGLPAVRLARSAAPFARSPDARRLWMWSTIGEGVGIFVAIQIVVNMGRPEWQLPALAAIVGLHFFPLAKAFEAPGYSLLGAILLLVALAGFLTPPPMGILASGFGAGLAEWGAAALILRRLAR